MKVELASFLGNQITILSISPLSGGGINNVYKVKTDHGVFCVKQNNKDRFPEMLKKEALGLKNLDEKSQFRIPNVIGTFEDEVHQYLVLEFLESGNPAGAFWEEFGKKLAHLHKVKSDQFGWRTDNYIGSLPQSNKMTLTWNEFYAEERILPQLKHAFDTGHIDQSVIRLGERLCNRLEKLFPKELPSLLHGDLWSGNYMIDTNGTPVLIDPAIYFGHREMDLGMMQLFGGFSEELFTAYNDSYPLENNWQSRISLTQLYPLLVHVNLFGGGYVQSVASVIQKYS